MTDEFGVGGTRAQGPAIWPVPVAASADPLGPRVRDAADARWTGSVGWVFDGSVVGGSVFDGDVDMADDSTLVERYLGGDTDAFAAIYDRYASRIHDLSLQMVRNRHDAADLTSDVFVAAAEHLHKLRDPSKLSSWLYAIARNEVFRNTKRRGRERPELDVADMIPSTDDGQIQDLIDGAGERRSAIAVLRDAAAGLDERDRLVMELSMVHDLDPSNGSSLAEALGVSESTAHQVTHRMRERLARSVAALMVARQGRAECADLDQVLSQWGGDFTVVWRKRIARHIDSCDVCERRRAGVPAMLIDGASAMSGAPISFVAPPSSVRDAVLASIGSGKSVPWGWDGAGFPVERRARPRWAIVAAVTLLLGLLTFGAATLLGQNAAELTVSSSQTTIALPSTSTSTTTVPATSTTAVAVVPTEAPPATAPVTSTAPTTRKPTPSTTVVAPPIPPTALPPTTPASTTTTLVDRTGPTLTLRFPAPITSAPCTPSTLNAVVGDPSGIRSVTATYVGQTQGSLTFTSQSATNWINVWSPPTPGPYTVTVTATDNRGNSTTASNLVSVQTCIG